MFFAFSLLILALLVLGPGCGLDGELESNPVVITVQPVPRRVPLPGGDTEDRRRLVDGFATDPEWRDVPYAQIAVGPENGNGGGSFLASVKVAHDSTRLYVLVQWPDNTPNRLGPRLVWTPDRALSPAACDSLIVDCSWRLVEEDEDRLSIMWDMGDARDRRGSFRDLGCQVACHGNMHPTSGSVDVWQWRAARTNQQNFPLTSVRRVGFADDGYADAGGWVADPGESFFRDNYRMTSCGDGGTGPVPLKSADAIDANGQPSSRNNDFMNPCDFIYDPAAGRVDCFSRENPCRLFEQADVVDWVAGDDLSAILLWRPENESARQSRHDIEARGRYTQIMTGTFVKGTWTLEMSRLLLLGNSEDVDFDVSRAEPYHMALAIMNNDGETHSGSPVIELRFQP